MTLAADASTIIVPGKVDILIAYPSAYSSLYKLGESEGEITVQKRPWLTDIYGDRHGGREGPPIERQMLGYTAHFALKMSRYDKAEIAKLENYGGLYTTNGTVPLTSIGALVMASRSVRILLYCTRDTTQTLNFPCCLWDDPVTVGRQTKYSSCGIQFTGYRAPENHWEVSKAGIVWDTDVTGMS